VIYEDLRSVLAEEGLAGTLRTIDQLMKQHRPGLVAVDSFKAFHPFATDLANSGVSCMIWPPADVARPVPFAPHATDPRWCQASLDRSSPFGPVPL
jgi:hypothetical protein